MNVWEIALGFMDSQVLLTADEIGLFDALDPSGATALEVSATTRLPRDSAERLLTALCALRLITKDAVGRFHNTPEAATQLVRGNPGYIGAMFHHVREHLYPAWSYCKEALFEQRPQWSRAFPNHETPTAAMYEDPTDLRSFLEGMHAITYSAAVEFAAATDLRSLRHIVDVGGASGAFVIALAEAFPNLLGTVYDLPAVRPIAEDFICRSRLEKRVQFHAANFWDDAIPDHADAYALGFVLHDWETEGGSFILQKIAKACRLGALLIIGEFLLNDDHTGPIHVARQNLNMLIAARGRERSAAEYRRWIRRFGFELEEIYPTSGGKHFLLARYHPYVRTTRARRSVERAGTPAPTR